MGSARGDLAIRGGFVVDGTGTPGRGARRVIDARDRVVAPWFIDIHTHSDFTLPLNPRAESKIRQRVTMEVVGNSHARSMPSSSTFEG